jgi:glycine C-acetyltransferase
MLYDERTAGEMAKTNVDKGVFVVGFSYPVVPKGRARIRTQVCASHSVEQLRFVVECFKQVRAEMGLSK